MKESRSLNPSFVLWLIIKFYNPNRRIFPIRDVIQTTNMIIAKETMVYDVGQFWTNLDST